MNSCLIDFVYYSKGICYPFILYSYLKKTFTSLSWTYLLSSQKRIKLVDHSKPLPLPLLTTYYFILTHETVLFLRNLHFSLQLQTSPFKEIIKYSSQPLVPLSLQKNTVLSLFYWPPLKILSNKLSYSYLPSFDFYWYHNFSILVLVG